METTYKTPGAVEIVIEIAGGDIDVHTGDIAVTNVKIVDPKPDDYEVTCEPTSDGGDRVVIRYRGKRRWLGAADADIEIDCPVGTALIVTSGSADVVLRGKAGSLQVRGGSGDLDFDHVDGDVAVKLASGDVRGGYVGRDFTYHGASGDVRVERVGGDVVAKTVSGDLEVEALDGSASVTSVSGDVVFRSLSKGEAQIRSVSGDVEVGVASGTQVFLDLAARAGEAHSNLDMIEAPVIEAQLLELKVHTVSGDIRVRRAPARV